jgi:hypothetical protein
MAHNAEGEHSPEIEAQRQAYLARKAHQEAERVAAVEAIQQQVATFTTRDALIHWARQRLKDYQDCLSRGESPSGWRGLESFEVLVRAAAIHGWPVAEWPTPQQYAAAARRITYAGWRAELPDPRDLETLLMPWRCVAESVSPGNQPRSESVPLPALRIRRAEAEQLVRDYLKRIAATGDVLTVTRNGVAHALGISGAMVSRTAAWKAFQEKRSTLRKPGERTIPLSDEMLCVLGKEDEELQRLIDEQTADREADEWPVRRRRS